MNVNPIQLIQMIKNGSNPQQLVMSLLRQGNGNPILQNATNLMQGGNIAGLEMLARNLASQRGLDFDTEFNRFKS